jgi:ComF family protein
MEGPRCRSCALPLPFVAGESLCLECSTAPLPLEWCDAWGRYRAGLERVLQAFKFRRHDFLDDALGELLAQTVTSHGDPEFDAIVPVPMSRAKLRRRGYNQAERLARSLAQHLGSECDERLLVRSGEEHLTQSTLPRSERAANVRRAFTASPDANGLRILIVDDICTTGETLRACATVLTRAKAATVCAVTVARVE